MGQIGLGYGSEWHLLRFLGRHRSRLDQIVCDATGGSSVSWLDFCFGGQKTFYDRERAGVGFLDDRSIESSWSQFWPQTGNPPNWDAVGRARIASTDTWLLAEAKAHLGEDKTDCQAKGNGLEMIKQAFVQTKKYLGVEAETDWLRGHYQYCNRLATLYFLREHGIPAKLLFVYFMGDSHSGMNCPETEEDWEEEMANRDAAVGMPAGHPLESHIHHVFVDARGDGSG